MQKATTDGVVVDLSEHIHQIAAYQDISELLSPEQEQKIVSYVKSMVEMSHSRISKRYSHWKEADRAHDVYVDPDATDFRNKIVIADTRAIADTTITYLMAALTGRNPMFQFEGLNRSSRKGAAILERVLHQNMRRTAGEARIAQHLLDCVRYGFAPTKIHWAGKENTNQIINFDPRRTFPDPRVNWGDWDNAQYVVFTDYIPYNALHRSGLYPRLKKDPTFRDNRATPRSGWKAHQWHKEEGRGLSIDPASPAERDNSSAHFTLGASRVVDEAWVRMAGYEIGVPSIEEIFFVITLIDEDRVIRLQANPYGRQIPAVLGGLFYDSHKTFSQSMYDLLLPLHDLSTWLLRSRVDNVQAALSNLIFVDPTQVSVPDLIDRNPWGIVRTLPGVKPGEGIHIAQIPDVTAGHWNDIAALSDLKQRVSAASDAQQGMPTPDVRTATEIQRLTQLGSQRLGVLARVISATSIRPMARMMAANIQDALTYEGSVMVDEKSTPGLLKSHVQDGYLDFNIGDLQGDIDYLVVDGTLPIEPTRNAETWMNLVQVMNQTGLAMEYDMGRIAEEGIRAMGVPDLEQFRISKEQAAQGPSPSQQLQLMEKMRGASVQPNEQLQRQVEKGNLAPLREVQRK